MDHLTIVAAYFNQPQIFERWWEELMAYPDELSSKVSLRFVDDHSDEGPKQLGIPLGILEKFDVQAFRVLDNIPWNEMGARNLAMQNAKGWCYMTDPDYILTAENAQKLFGDMALASGPKNWHGPVARGFFYHLKSVLHSDGRVLHRPENIGVVHTEDFWKTGGYDENFAGGYGFSDTLLWRALREVAGCKDVFVDDVVTHHYSKGIIELEDGTRITDAASPATRDTTRNQPIFKGANAEIKRKGWKRFLRDRGSVVRFKWERFA